MHDPFKNDYLKWNWFLNEILVTYFDIFALDLFSTQKINKLNDASFYDRPWDRLQIIGKTQTCVDQHLQNVKLWMNYLEWKVEDFVLLKDTLCSEDFKLTKKRILQQFGKCGITFMSTTLKIFWNYDSLFIVKTLHFFLCSKNYVKLAYFKLEPVYRFTGDFSTLYY